MTSKFSQIVQKAREAFKFGKTRDIAFRKKQLKALQLMYKENVELFVKCLSEDLRKPRQEAILLELNFLIDDIGYILDRIDQWTTPEVIPATIITLFDKSVIYPDPYGVVLVMGAWNYPLQLPLLPVSGAIAAGNSVIIKPSEVAPATAAVISELIPKYLDQECYHVVCGGVPETTELLKERFDYIFYTGSTTVGKIVREASNKYLTPTTLELGGKSPVFIDNTVNLDVAVRRLIWGKCINLGQTCVAPDYVLCTKDIRDQIVEKAKEILKEWYGDDPQRSPDLCRVINDRHFSRLVEYLKDGKPAVGGYYDEADKWIEPTLLVNVSEDSKMVNIFFLLKWLMNPLYYREAPLALYLFTTSGKLQKSFIYGVKCGSLCINDVVVHIGRRKFNYYFREKPLAFYIFSKNKKRVNTLLTETSYGGSCVNDVLIHLSVPGLPFGGVGNSGMGSYHGKASFDCFSHKKSCLIRNYNKIADLIAANRYPPYSEKKINFLSFMLKERALPSWRSVSYVFAFSLGILTYYVSQQISKISWAESSVIWDLYKDYILKQ
ncbi:Aldehyde dehydrogenase, dimeric NADP-preferring [Armadillidium nasatum]|uniref:Aldehyde dehydrogenase n=1 Tax=Armadillidium nasatum TaxID=96803 RepID=A0A5N5T1M7_9CRUS|nr:Aldehyde dehydrogenase, dimeric NADP-preferring [Armadillidium nasatum]